MMWNNITPTETWWAQDIADPVEWAPLDLSGDLLEGNQQWYILLENTSKIAVYFESLADSVEWLVMRADMTEWLNV